MRKKTKFVLLRAAIILLFAVLAGRVWYVQVVMGSYYRQQADTSKIRLEPVQALRGIIYDRYGRPLVFNAPSWSVTIVPHGIPRSRATEIYRRLSSLLHGDPSAARISQLVDGHRWQPYAPFVVKPKVDADTAMIIKQLHSQLPGVRADPSSIRQYVKDPQFSLSHLLGYTGEITQDQYGPDRRMFPKEHFGPTDQIGRAGIEASMDPYLHGVNGTDEVEVDAGERPVRVLRHGKTVAGDSIYLTLDWKLQQQVSQDLAAALQKLNVSQGVAIVEDVRNGQILSMVSLPSYDNNWFAGGISQKRYDALLHAPGQPLNDLAVYGMFPPGSTYKVITASAALQTQVADVNRFIFDGGSIRLCSVYSAGVCRVYWGWAPGGLGAMNVVSALAQSSDIYFYTVAGGNPNNGPMPAIGANRLATYARFYGLGAPTGIELLGEPRGLVPSQYWYNHLKTGDPRRPSADYTWHIGDTYNMAIGQGFNDATPLQMANIAATIANGGIRFHPRIIQRVAGQVIPRQGILARQQTLLPFVPSIAAQGFIDPANLRLVQEGMHQSVNLGFPTGTSFAVTDKRIDAAGKTGTAEAGDKPPHAWWIGYAPFNHPRVAVCVMVPYAGGEGAYVAAPIAHKVLEDYFHLPSNKPNWLDDVRQQLVPSPGGAQ